MDRETRAGVGVGRLKTWQSHVFVSVIVFAFVFKKIVIREKRAGIGVGMLQTWQSLHSCLMGEQVVL